MAVDKVAFTGSTEVGHLIQQAAGRSNLKKVTLELGGKSPLIVLDDADLDHAVEMAHFALFFNQGQCCCAGSRLMVQEGIYDEFVKRAAERAKRRSVGDPFAGTTEQGPQVDEEQLKKVLSFIQSGVAEGAALRAGGARWGSRGFFVEPTVFSEVRDDMKICREEIFGPVLAVRTFSTEEEALRIANATEFGLSNAVLSGDEVRCERMARQLRSGIVWINHNQSLPVSIPFGGFKKSGFGKEYGIEGLNEFLQAKSIVKCDAGYTWGWYA